MVDLRPAAGPRMVLQLNPRDEGLAVRVSDSPVGEGAASDIVLQHIEEVMRMVSRPAFHEDVGRGLFRSLFPGQLGDLYRAAYTQATLNGERLTVELRFDSELVRIARYPWELLHDGTRFLLQAGAVNLVRYMTFPEPPRPLTPHYPLEVLLVSAQPKDRPPLMSEFDTLQGAFKSLISDGQLDLAYLVPATWDALMDWVLAGAPGILHFEGHGAFTRTGFLVFEDNDGVSDPVDARTIANAFYGTGLRLAVLNACESAQAGDESLLGSVAPALVLAGIPAVVAMQQSLPDGAAVRFARGFYNALLAGNDIESAMVAGRKQLIRTMYWHIPTLYLRAAPVGSVQRAYLERRIDTAGPQTAPVNLPLRFGVWLRRPESPPPSDDDLRRLLALEPAAGVSREETPARMQFPVEMGAIQPGTVEVRITAPNCEIHTPAHNQMTVFPDFDTPPLWFLLTPRQTGRLDIIVEITQQGSLIASVAHTITIAAQAEAVPVAGLRSHAVGEGAAPELKPVARQEPPPAPAAPAPAEPSTMSYGQPPEEPARKRRRRAEEEAADMQEAAPEPAAPSLQEKAQKLIERHVGRVLDAFGERPHFAPIRAHVEWLLVPDVLDFCLDASVEEMARTQRDARHYWRSRRFDDLLVIVSTIPTVSPDETSQTFDANYLGFLMGQIPPEMAQARQGSVAHWILGSDGHKTTIHLTFLPLGGGMTIWAEDMLSRAEKDRVGIR